MNISHVMNGSVQTEEKPDLLIGKNWFQKNLIYVHPRSIKYAKRVIRHHQEMNNS